MATREEILAALNGQPSPTLTPTRSRADILADLNQPVGFAPPTPPTPSREQSQRATRLKLIREQAAAGKPVDFGKLPLSTEQLAQRVNIDGSDVQREVFASMPTLGRSAILGGAALGAVIEDPILRLRGRGDQADQNWRNLNALNDYSTRLAQEGPLGETAGTILHSVGSSLTTGTLAAPFGGTGATGNLAASSVAFGLDGADRDYVAAKDAGLPHKQAMATWFRSFLINGALTFGVGKWAQKLGFNPGRYAGQSLGKAAQIAAEKSGAARVLGSAAFDATTEGIQGSLDYLNKVYSGLDDFSWGKLGENLAMSALTGGVAGAATSGVSVASDTVAKAQEFKTAFEQFQKEFPKAVAGVKAANEFAATATPEQVEKALAATTAKEFAEATGQKGKNPTQRESFQLELEELDTYRAELEGLAGVQRGSLIQRETALGERRLKLAEADEVISRLKSEVSEMSKIPGKPIADVVRKRAELLFRENEAAPLRKEIQDESDAIAAKRAEIQGEVLEHRAYLESEINRHVAEQAGVKQERGESVEVLPDMAGLTPPVRQRTPQTFAERYSSIGSAIETVGNVTNKTLNKQPVDDATRRDLGKLIDTHAEGQDNRVRLHQSLTRARTPGQMRKAMESLGKHLHESEKRVAKEDYQDAVKKAKHLRPEQQAEIAALMPTREGKKRKKATGVDFKNVDSMRDAAEAIRVATYQSAVADTMLASQRDESITRTADQMAAEVSQARPLAMKSDDPIRRALGRVTPEDRITRGTADSPLIREATSRPEVQLSRLGDTAHRLFWNDLGVEAQAKYNDYTDEARQGFERALEGAGLEHGDSIAATVRNLLTSGRGTGFNNWRRTEGFIEGVPMKRADAWFLHLLDKDPRNAAVLSKGGWVFPDGRQLPKFNDRVRNQLRDFVGPEGEALANWAFRYTNGPVIDRVNDAWRQLTGRPLTQHKDVVPRVTEQTWDAVGENAFKMLTDPKLSGYGHLKHREETAGPLTWPKGTADGFDYMMRHWDRMNRIAAFAVPARDAQAVLNKPNVIQAIQAVDGKEGLDNIREALRVQVAGPRQAPVGWDLRRRNAVAAAATIGWRLPTWMIQGTGAVLSAAWNPRGVRNFVKAMPALWSNDMRQEMQQVLGQHSAHYRLKFLRNDYATQQSGGIYQVADRLDPPTIAQHAMRPQRAIDHDVVSPLHYGQAKATVMDQGIQPGSQAFGPAVAREWERSMYRGETAAHGMELPGFLRSGTENAAVGMWAVFQNQGARLYSLIPRAMDLADKGQYKDAIAVGAVALASALATATIRAFTSTRDTGDETLPENVGKNLALEFAGSPPILGLFLQPLARSAMNMRSYGDSPLVVEDAMDFAKAVGDVAGQILDQSELADDPQKFFDNLMGVTGSLAKFAGTPVGGLDDFRKRLQSGAAADGVFAGLAEFFPGLKKQEGEISWQEAVDALTTGE